MKYYGIIYCVTNIINGHKYIGQTTVELDKRRHVHEILTNKKKSVFQYALLKYGIQNFYWDIIDTADNYKDLDDKERYYISFYNTYYKDGYNCTTGGQDGFGKKKYKPIITYDIDGNFLNRYNSQAELAIELDVGNTDVYKAVCGKRPYVRDCIVMFESEFSEEKLKEKILRAEWQKKKFRIILTEDDSIIYEGRDLKVAEQLISVNRNMLYLYFYNHVKNGKYRAEYV